MKIASWTVLVSAAFLLSGCLQISDNGFFGRTIHGSGVRATETRAVSGFDQVGVSGSGQITIIQGDEESLTIEADDNFLPLIKSEVVNGKLRIGPERVSLRASQPIRYKLKLKRLTALSLSGSLAAEADSLKTETLTVSISGSGKVRLARLEADDFKVRISGSGDLNLAGKVTHQELRISGSGDYRAAELDSQHAEVHISGSGDALLTAQQTLDVHISGSGKVQYYGHPSISKSISGSGSLRRLGGR